MAENDVFEIGLVMAGAISAGAYTAGVMDFIFEALDAYEEAKAKPGWTGPTHKVRIPVMAGASAGGMTSAISALHAFRDLEHVWPGQGAPAPERNRLYSSWVTDISLEKLLETTDLEGGREYADEAEAERDGEGGRPRGGAFSLLCCDALDRIVADAFTLSSARRPRAWIGRGDGRLRVMMTLTNVRGVPYSFSLFGATAAEQYGMLNHADCYDFAVGAGAAEAPRGAVALDVDRYADPAWKLYKTAALATGAFPIGLRPRIIERPDQTSYFSTLPDPVPPLGADRFVAGCVGYDDEKNQCFVPLDPDSSFRGEAPYRFIAVDGGTINNAPLELARRYLAGASQRNERDGSLADKAVVMIAPFPSQQTAPAADKDPPTLVHLIPKLASMLIDQARFKPDELALASSDLVFSRFMISPTRAGNGSDKAKDYPIASGVMGGFGGFIHESFRRHDYLLGRRNTQAFLRFNFGLPDNNPRFKDVAIDRRRWLVRDADKATGSLDLASSLDLDPKPFASTVEGDDPRPGFPIIPLVDRLCKPIEIGWDDMPNPAAVDLEDLKRRIHTRAKKVVETMLAVDLKDEVSSFIPVGGHFAGHLATEAATAFAAHIATEKACDMVNGAVEDVAAAFALG